MAVPMALGPFMFHSLRFGYNGLRRDLSTRWADIATVGGLNRMQWTGGDDDLVQIEGVSFRMNSAGWPRWKACAERRFRARFFR